jgi:hypothetical protein
MLLSSHHNADKKNDVNVEKKLFENMSQFKHLGTTIADQNFIQKEIKRRVNFGIACHHSVQNILSSRLCYQEDQEVGGWIIFR